MKSKPKKSKNNKNVVKKLQKELRSILSIEKKRIDIELSFTDETEFLEIIDELRKKFPEIRGWSYFTLRRYDKLLYFPIGD